MHQYPGTDDQLLQDPKAKPKGSTNIAVAQKRYMGATKEQLDAPASLQEGKQALFFLTRNTAPGRDKIPKILRNLDEKSIDRLTEYFNAVWYNSFTRIEERRCQDDT